MRKLIISCSFALLLTGTPGERSEAAPSASPSPAQQREQVTIGVLAYQGAEKTLKLWAPTADYLSEAIPGYQFRIMPLTLDTIGNAVAEHKVGFVLTNPASYAALEHEYGISRIATLIKRRNSSALTQFAAVILTRRDRKDINTLKDLRGKTFMAVHPNAFGGWQMAWREMADAGIEPHRDFKAIQYSGFPQSQIVHGVLAGKVDAGTVRTGVLEQLIGNGDIRRSQIKIINQKHHPGFPFLHSTDLYPEWPFATTRTTSRKLAHQVVNALLQMPADDNAAKVAGIYGWTIPLSYQPVHDLMRTLQVGHFQRAPQSLVSVFKQHGHWIMLGTAIILILMTATTYVILLNRKLKRSSRQLQQEVQERKTAQACSQEQTRRLNALYEISSMSRLSYEDQLTEVLKVGCSVFNTEIGRICQINTAENTNTIIAVHAPESFAVQPGHRVPLDKTFCNIPFRKREPIAIHDVGESPWAVEACYQFAGFETYIAIPFAVNGELFGTINFCSFNTRPQPFEEADIEFIQMVGRWAGVTIERHLAAQLEKEKVIAQASNHAKSEFLAKVSHELRTPLNAVIGYSEMLLEDFTVDEQPQTHDDLQKINDSANYLLRLINDLLDVSKIEAGKMELYFETIDIGELVEGITTAVRPLARKNANVLEIRYSKDIGTMLGDYLRIRQVLVNILSNATKFTRDGKIVFSAELQEHPDTTYVMFTITDTGIGINPDKINTLFQDFAQADAAITRDYGGTGLGLSISRRLCRLMKGDISVTSELGQGSSFSVKLPRQAVVGTAPNVSLNDTDDEKLPKISIS